MSGSNNKKIQFCQSYSYVNRKVWYHQIWIPNSLGFIVSDLMFVLHAIFGDIAYFSQKEYFANLREVRCLKFWLLLTYFSFWWTVQSEQTWYFTSYKGLPQNFVWINRIKKKDTLVKCKILSLFNLVQWENKQVIKILSPQ